MQTTKAIFAGILGTTSATVAMAVCRAFGWPANLEMVLGSAITGVLGPGTWLLGFLVTIIAGIGFSLLYAAMFEYVVGDATWRIGLRLGAAHSLVSGVLVGVLPYLHRLAPEDIAQPRPFLAHWGVSGVLVFVGVHLLYGAVVGSTYKPVRLEHRRPALA